MSKESNNKALNEAKVLRGEIEVPGIKGEVPTSIILDEFSAMDVAQEIDLSAFNQKKERQFPGNSGLS